MHNASMCREGTGRPNFLFFGCFGCVDTCNQSTNQPGGTTPSSMPSFLVRRRRRWIIIERASDLSTSIQPYFASITIDLSGDICFQTIDAHRLKNPLRKGMRSPWTGPSRRSRTSRLPRRPPAPPARLSVRPPAANGAPRAARPIRSRRRWSDPRTGGRTDGRADAGRLVPFAQVIIRLSQSVCQ